MHVNYSGWTESHGSFHCNVFIDEKKQDYAVVYGDGTVCKQVSPFRYETADWNNDGDVYTLFGAWFKGLYGGNTFYSVEDLVSLAADGLSKERFYNNEVKQVLGVTIPLLEKRQTLEERIKASENRAMHQELEKNRKMDTLGIHHPKDPWAR